MNIKELKDVLKVLGRGTLVKFEVVGEPPDENIQIDGDVRAVDLCLLARAFVERVYPLRLVEKDFVSYKTYRRYWEQVLLLQAGKLEAEAMSLRLAAERWSISGELHEDKRIEGSSFGVGEGNSC